MCGLWTVEAAAGSLPLRSARLHEERYLLPPTGALGPADFSSASVKLAPSVCLWMHPASYKSLVPNAGARH